jgi:hypothetical protein
MRDEPSWTASAALDLEVEAAVELAVLEEPPEAPVAVTEEPEPVPRYYLLANDLCMGYVMSQWEARTCSCARCRRAGACWGAARGCWGGASVADAVFKAGLYFQLGK